MKILGILIILAGLLMAGGGVLGAVLNFSTASDPWGSCSSADKKFSEAQASVRQWEAVKGTTSESWAKKKADTDLAVAGIAEKGCADLKQTYKIYAYASIVAAAIGLGLMLIGAVLWRRSGRPRNSSVASGDAIPAL